VPFTKQTALALFFPEPMDELDFQNLRMSECRRVQLFYRTALVLPRQLEVLAQMGVSVTLRLEEPSQIPISESYYSQANHGSIRAGIEQIRRKVPVQAVIVGNEPEHPYNLAWGHPWGNTPTPAFPSAGGRAQAHSDAVAALQPILKGLGVKAVSPGWTHKRITPRDDPQPGRMTWRELCAGAYNACDGNGAHVYAHNFISPEDENRYLWALGEEVARCHRSVWLNETNVNTRGISDAERMAKVRAMAELIAAQGWGGRVVTFCPFTSNGRDDEEWSHLIMRSPQAYFELGQWLQQP
jgi:hypothetical protein